MALLVSAAQMQQLVSLGWKKHANEKFILDSKNPGAPQIHYKVVLLRSYGQDHS